jgi:DnaK suppressor protein
MTPADRDRFRARLLAMRDEIVRGGDLEIEPARKDPGDVGGDEDEQPLNEMHQVIASKRNRERAAALARIDGALARLAGDPDAFGLCAECDEPLGRRLEAIPYVELCVECQRARDGDAKPGRRRHLTDYR